MLLEALLIATILLPRAGEATVDLPRRTAPLAAALTARAADAGPAAFSLVARAVSNWRTEASASLAPGSLAYVVQYAERDPSFVARCVKLNNYWCIKRAAWTGEIGGDDEGHTAFATAEDGAGAAAVLLRRYSRDFGRRTALAIVRRWAPASCGSGSPTASPRDGSVSRALAPRGLGRTLRARYLARNARGGAPRRVVASRIVAAGGLRVQPWSARARLAGRPGRALPGLGASRTVPDIAEGITVRRPEPAARTDRGDIRDAPRRDPARSAPPATRDPSALLAPERLAAEAAALPALAAGLPASAFLDLRVPQPVCGNDEARIRNYADAIARSVGLGRDDDLGLFDAAGSPTARLAPVMEAMSRVELGALRASRGLVERAIARLAPGTTARAD